MAGAATPPAPISASSKEERSTRLRLRLASSTCAATARPIDRALASRALCMLAPVKLATATNNGTKASRRSPLSASTICTRIPSARAICLGILHGPRSRRGPPRADERDDGEKDDDAEGPGRRVDEQHLGRAHLVGGPPVDLRHVPDGK